MKSIVFLSVANRQIQPILSESPKSNSYRFDRTQTYQTIRTTNTWTRTSTRKIISPLNIPTFSETTSNRSRHPKTNNDDEFERFSPTLTDSQSVIQEIKNESKSFDEDFQ